MDHIALRQVHGALENITHGLLLLMALDLLIHQHVTLRSEESQLIQQF